LVIVVLAVFAFGWVFSWSPFSHPSVNDAVEYLKDGAVNPNVSKSGLGLNVCYFQLFLAFTLLTVVVLSFLADICDSIRNQIHTRFRYQDTQHNADEELWWSIVIVVIGYCFRLFIFGAVGYLGIKAANTISVVTGSTSIFLPMSDPPRFDHTSDALLFVLNAPLASLPVRGVDCFPATVFVCYFAFARLLTLTFLVGVFYNVLSGLKTKSPPSFQQP
jgi:hypothetical protein